jgi:UPF0755 protein
VSVRAYEAEARARLVRRRVVAVAVFAACVALLGWLLVALLRSGSEAPPVTSTPVAPPTLHIVFPEGFTREQMAARIAAVDGIAKARRGISPHLSAADYRRLTASSAFPGRFAGDGQRRPLEGFLFPATYAFHPRTTSKRLVAQQVAAFKRNWSQVSLRFARAKNLTRWDVLIIASLIEKEVAAPEERAKVASVIYNRLGAGMKLGIDATVRYGLHVPATEPLHESQLNDPNPYNTRVHAGLPPGPIANPGLASMQAAAHPLRTSYLFFVRKPDKRHHYFTASEADFDRYKREHGYG